MDERDVPRRAYGRPYEGDQYGASYGYDDDPRYNRGYPADRGGSGPHFYDPRMTGPLNALPDLDDDGYDDEDAPKPKWRRRTAVAALGAGAAALIGGGAYAVTKFFGDAPRTPNPTTAAQAQGDTAPPSYNNQDESYMNGQAGIGVRKNTPTHGSLYDTPSQAANAAVVTANTVLPKKDPVRHLASRLTFGPTPKVIADIKSMGIDKWIDKQLKPTTIPDTRGEQKLATDLPLYGMTYDQLVAGGDANGKKGLHADDANVRYAIGKMIWSDRQLFEMTVDMFNDFLHIAAYKDGNEYYRADFDRNVVRKHAFGNYVDMLTAAVSHPAMLNYLDQQQSTKDDINENLGREILELFSVGAFNGYNETDVRQAAMLQTGRSIRAGAYVYRPETHYVGPVKVMGFSSPNATAAVGEAVQLAYFKYVALHPNTAKYLAQTMATRFVSDTPPASIVTRMAKAYTDSKGQIVPMITTMLRSTEFWASVGQKVRRPMEYLTATYRALGVQPDAPAGYTQNNTNQSPFAQGLNDLQNKLTDLGQFPMGMATPNGYPDVYVAWTSAGTMINNWNEAHDAVQGNRKMFSYIKPEQLLGTTPPNTAGAYLDALTKRLVNATFTTKQKTPILAIAKASASTPVDATFNGAIVAIVRAIFATPHHHLR
jgi:uncharacterized protein (DUF1800 family)